MKILYGDDRSPETLAFLEEIVEVSRKHNKWLGHEDGHGSFEVSPGDPEDTFNWLLEAAEILYD